MSDIVKGFKGFDKNFQCRGFQYEAGKDYTHKGSVSLCSSGFHFCENPLDVLGFYGVAQGNRYATVEGSNVSEERESGNSKRVAKSLHIEAEISLSHLIGAGIQFVLDKATKPTSGDYAHSATSGDYAHSAFNRHCDDADERVTLFGVLCVCGALFALRWAVYVAAFYMGGTR